LPAEEQEALVDEAPFLPQETNIVENVAAEHGPPTRGRLAKLAAVVALSGLVGTSIALLRKGSESTEIAEPESVSALWDGSRVRCGAYDTCTCEWANEQMCRRKDDPHTRCWGCCCKRLYPQQYRWALSQPSWGNDHHNDYPVLGHGNGDYYPEDDYPNRPGYGHGHSDHFPNEYHRGQDVNVMSHQGTWHPATILRQVASGRYQVQYDLSRRVEVVSQDHLAPGYWTPWWVWVFWACLFSCAIFAVIGFVGWLAGGRKRRAFDW